MVWLTISKVYLLKSGYVYLLLIFFCLDPTFFPQRCAEIVYRGSPIGRMGVLHPTVLNQFDVSNPCSAVEINIEPFL